jgi:hypothetical protein
MTTRATAEGYVIVSDTDAAAYFVERGDVWGTLPHVDPIRFATWKAARVYIRGHFQGGRALLIPGAAPRILSARAAGLPRL